MFEDTFPGPTRSVHVTGASDDTVVVTGAIEAEFLAYTDDGEQGVLHFNDGAMLRVRLDGEVWRIDLRSSGGRLSTVVIESAPVAGLDRDYTERAQVTGNFTSVTCINDGGRGPTTVYAEGFEPREGDDR